MIDNYVTTANDMCEITLECFETRRWWTGKNYGDDSIADFMHRLEQHDDIDFNTHTYIVDVMNKHIDSNESEEYKFEGPDNRHYKITTY